ncbi:MAG: magnesium transporter [Methyloligellaceae bacterium]
MQETAEQTQLRDDDGTFQPDFVRAVESLIESQDQAALRTLIRDLHEGDVADLVEFLRPELRFRLIETLGEDFDSNVLPELDEPVRDQLIEEMPNEQVAEAVRELDSDDAVYVLEDLEASEQSDILAKIPEVERAALERSLEYPEDSAGRLMQADVIAVPPFWSVGQTIDYMRETDDLPETFSELYVVDPAFHPFGSVPLSKLLRTKRPVRIEAITDQDLYIVDVAQDQEDVARDFERYSLISAPVVDENKRLVGVVTADDIVEVVQEEAEEDIHRLGGVGDESLADTVLRTTKNRLAWLLFNLVTAVMASIVISWFDATIEEMVALAILMPIVASMGGNAGTQTMTVAVRALATKELGPINARRLITREGLVGLFNGSIFAVIMAAVTIVWFGSNQLGAVIAAAMVFNMLVAGLAGIVIPLVLDWLKVDPAVASTVFVTTVTDVVGFFAFLSLAALWLV